MLIRALSLGAVLIAIACSASSSDDVGNAAGGGASGKGGKSGKGGSGGSFNVGGSGNGGSAGSSNDDPKTCAEAAAAHSYIGCEFWPVPVANEVWQEFDFA